ncbi:MAG: hypothetical protein IJN54_06215 [Lachnospiraceae bacterium]|nr:hypothetical protein [Lachnospiraceae bacterium]
MNYAWEAVLLAEKDKRNRDELRFVEASAPSPYIEVSVTDLNMESPEEDRIEINPLYRFEDVFGQLFDKNIEDMMQTRELFFDVCMHYIVQLDLREGLSKEDYYYSLIAEDINSGKYDEAVRRRFELFELAEQKVILRTYLRLLKTGNYLEEFRKAMTKLYPHAFIYENNETAYELLVYLGVKETDKERERITLLREMFLPMQETVHFFYEYHFGIIDVDETMVIDEVVIF